LDDFGKAVLSLSGFYDDVQKQKLLLRAVFDSPDSLIFFSQLAVLSAPRANANEVVSIHYSHA
jgi:hypothetical protein